MKDPILPHWKFSLGCVIVAPLLSMALETSLPYIDAISMSIELFREQGINIYGIPRHAEHENGATILAWGFDSSLYAGTIDFKCLAFDDPCGYQFSQQVIEFPMDWNIAPFSIVQPNRMINRNPTAIIVSGQNEIRLFEWTLNSSASVASPSLLGEWDLVSEYLNGKFITDVILPRSGEQEYVAFYIAGTNGLIGELSVGKTLNLQFPNQEYYGKETVTAIGSDFAGTSEGNIYPRSGNTGDNYFYSIPGRNVAYIDSAGAVFDSGVYLERTQDSWVEHPLSGSGYIYGTTFFADEGKMVALMDSSLTRTTVFLRNTPTRISQTSPQDVINYVNKGIVPIPGPELFLRIKLSDAETNISPLEIFLKPVADTLRSIGIIAFPSIAGLKLCGPNPAWTDNWPNFEFWPLIQMNTAEILFTHEESSCRQIFPGYRWEADLGGRAIPWQPLDTVIIVVDFDTLMICNQQGNIIRRPEKASPQANIICNQTSCTVFSMISGPVELYNTRGDLEKKFDVSGETVIDLKDVPIGIYQLKMGSMVRAFIR